MTNSIMTDRSVVTDTVTTDTLVLTGSQIHTVDTTKLSSSQTAIPVSQVVYQALTLMQKQIDTIDPNHRTFTDQGVITEPLTSPIFADEALWAKNGWTIRDYAMHLVNKTDASYFRIPTSVYRGAGKYLICIQPTYIKDCVLCLYDRENALLATFTECKKYYVEVTVTDTMADIFTVRADNTVTTSEATVSYCGLMHIVERFYTYLMSKIDALTGVDGSHFVTRALLDQLLLNFQNDINSSINGVIDGVNTHFKADNPHGITCARIKAAELGHKHTAEEANAAAIGHRHEPYECNAAPADHNHDSVYTKPAQVVTTVNQVLEATIRKSPVVAPLTISDCVTGEIPHLYLKEGIDAQAQILVPSVLFHDAPGAYDKDAGMVITHSTHPVENEAYFVALDNEFPTIHREDVPAYLSYKLHLSRPLRGYRLFFDSTMDKPTSWNLYINYNQFVHQAVLNDVNTPTYTFLLPTPLMCDSITMEVTAISQSYPAKGYGVHILPLFNDVDTDAIGVTTAPFTLITAESGSTQLHAFDSSSVIHNLKPAVNLENVKLYTYLDISSSMRAEPGYTYIQPEYNNLRAGFTIKDLMQGLSFNWAEGLVYRHPFLGTLEPKQNVGVFGAQYLFDAYYSGDMNDSKNKYVYTNPGVYDMDITYTPQKPMMLSSYNLTFHQSFADRMPESWSLSATVMDKTGTVSNQVLDSTLVFRTRPDENGLLVYTKQFTSPVYILKMTFHFKTAKPNGMVVLLATPRFSEDYYSVAKNTMYHLHEEVKRIYVGEAIYRTSKHYTGEGTHGYTVSNTYLGNRCTVPVNDLEPCVHFQQYKVPNPYGTKDVICQLKPTKDTLEAAQATINSVERDMITVTTYSATKFMMDIIRMW